ncbi:PAC2 family protein, partial [Planctomycetota bacterium]
MADNKLIVYNRPKLASPILVLGFSGWMDSGEVSTGTVEFLVNNLKAQKFALINPEGFYLQSFPSPMELSAMFRPYVKIKDGLIESYRTTSNVFFADIQNDIIFFLGKEPNLNWAQFSDTILSVCKEFA